MNKHEAHQISSAMALLPAVDIRDTMILLRDSARREFGDEYKNACAELESAINSQVDTNSIGVVATYALLCAVNNTDERLTHIVMACAAEQWLRLNDRPEHETVQPN